jgi:superfamily II helicase
MEQAQVVGRPEETVEELQRQLRIANAALRKNRIKTDEESDFRCGICTLILSEYMLRDEVWTCVMRRKNDRICIECAEKRLGRDLTIDDFKQVPVNKSVFHAYRMGYSVGVADAVKSVRR